MNLTIYYSFFIQSFGYQVLDNFEGFIEVDPPVDTFASFSDINTGLGEVANEVVIDGSEVKSITEKEHSSGSEVENVIDEDKNLRFDICHRDFKTKKTSNFHTKAKHVNYPVFAQKLKEVSASKSLKVSCHLCDQKLFLET